MDCERHLLDCVHTAVKVHSSAVEGWGEGRIVDKIKMYGYVDDERTR